MTDEKYYFMLLAISVIGLVAVLALVLYVVWKYQMWVNKRVSDAGVKIHNIFTGNDSVNEKNKDTKKECE